MESLLLLVLCGNSPFGCPSGQKIALIALLLLAPVLFWWWTGKLRIIGIVVKLLWLPLQAMFFLLGKAGQIAISPLLGNYSLVKVALLGWFAYCLFVVPNNPDWMPGTLALGAFWLFSLIFSQSLLALSRWQPRSRRQPTRPPVLAVVQVASPRLGSYEKEADILRQLPPHLQDLLNTSQQGQPNP